MLIAHFNRITHTPVSVNKYYFTGRVLCRKFKQKKGDIDFGSAATLCITKSQRLIESPINVHCLKLLRASLFKLLSGRVAFHTRSSPALFGATSTEFTAGSISDKEMDGSNWKHSFGLSRAISCLSTWTLAPIHRQMQAAHTRSSTHKPISSSVF